MSIPTPIITIGGRNSPFAVSLMMLCVLVGVLGVAGYEAAVPAYSPVDLKLWYLGLTVGGLLCLVGMFWRDPITGMLIERVGQFILASLMLAFGLGLLVLLGPVAFPLASGDLVFGIACIARVVQIHVVARKIRAAVKVIDEAQS